MFKLTSNLFNLLSPSQRKRFYVLQILVILMAIVEILGVASIIPFMSLVGDMTQLQQDTFIAKFYQMSGINSESQFVFILGICVLILLFISMIISVFTVWGLSMFANKIGTEIADRLYAHYLKQDWLFHASGSSAQLTKKIATETMRVTGAVLVPLMQLNSKVILSLLMSIGIFVYDPKVATIGLSIFAISYFFLFKGVRNRLNKNGNAISEVNEERFRLMNEGFGGIKDVLLMGRDNDFINRFKKTGKTLANSQGITAALAQAPRYFIELLAFGSMISLILYLIASHNGNLGLILPIISVYAIGTIKLLPAFQQIYSSIAIIRANIPAFESIQQDLYDSSLGGEILEKVEESYLHPKKQISLENVRFTYPNKQEPALDGLSMAIPINSVIGVVGPSGSGKSTLIDILLGLIEPDHGKLKIDNKIIDSKNCRSWQNTIGFVAQSIFLSEGSIAENIAFGIPNNEIDFKQVETAINLAHLSELVSSLRQGIHTKVGERGVQLSGGQRQRIGIARALYHKAEVLVFDEATSSLDGITEKMIMEAIHKFSGKKTIILIAHRLKTVQKCDNIFFINDGKVADQGTYDELIGKNEKFKSMADHA
ncbi:ABC transporter ATP-binding protein/permease [Gammaproteobacteria bacterium]|nr:ABC transporter ATP-binding protein/permease [Gammaproteobacteria bacterium]